MTIDDAVNHLNIALAQEAMQGRVYEVSTRYSLRLYEDTNHHTYRIPVVYVKPIDTEDAWTSSPGSN